MPKSKQSFSKHLLSLSLKDNIYLLIRFVIYNIFKVNYNGNLIVSLSSFKLPVFYFIFSMGNSKKKKNTPTLNWQSRHCAST